MDATAAAPDVLLTHHLPLRARFGLETNVSFVSSASDHVFRMRLKKTKKSVLVGAGKKSDKSDFTWNDSKFKRGRGKPSERVRTTQIGRMLGNTLT